MHKNCGAHLLPTSPHELMHRSLKSKEMLRPMLLPLAADPAEISRLAHTPAQIRWELKNCGAHLLPTSPLELLHRSWKSKEIWQAPRSSHQQPTQPKYHGSVILLHRLDGNWKIAGPTYCLLAGKNFCTGHWVVKRHCRPRVPPISSRPSRNITARSYSCTD